ncbi:CDP-diacylglycerol--glycerol-3-phosphate 3-phosphatidyltransferase [compost metagenome]|jgi:cardiolipin synthase|uniref:CDP-diacylglycerol--glycerol-3-phosphate 3-phosphatidyltransferase n=2 Tax=Cupriavidus necator TaxID=106590 RepID=G0ER67_CUPNN|nr:MULTISPECIES: CDP-diacylglycerol--glycerol-3-phosphate 3-phosphatidyltransferase [Cupriavidus]AEI77749.1 CDP-diacylglycerol--glycerol-3-phosphate 3-phosphatidyltransferase PgsA [Cupriavidus necator N-1]EYS94246.1 CDP-diacylglycerol--glycerol-3-phosphate 3-phosphatidyltransferase [Cupriavidus sp. SK-4]KAI3606467.1 CDP-diacylglycerol--glycerol-3-phosphate 3-phosphatidyltransferase [Cupriavidus necator H850]MDX6013716.1 CDP-diacylglycerol--glycerol-3-phosphate 3-phosphatidyltransferase [Cupriav
MPFNFPILLTWLRVAMIPLVVGVFYLPDAWLPMHAKNLTAASFFIIAAVTDWLDGFLARRWNQTSSFGAFLDPVADKLMVTAALLSLLALGRVTDLIALVIIGREITISALREWMAQIGASKSVAVNFLGKLKTTVQMVAIPLLLYSDRLLGFDAHLLGTWMIYVAAVLTLWSMFYYMKLAWPQIRERSGMVARAGAQK